MARPAQPLPDLVLGFIGEVSRDDFCPSGDEIAAAFHWYDPVAVVAALEGLLAQQFLFAMWGQMDDAPRVTVYGLSELGARRYDQLFPTNG